MAFASALRAGVARVRCKLLRSGLLRDRRDCRDEKCIKGSHSWGVSVLRSFVAYNYGLQYLRYIYHTLMASFSLGPCVEWEVALAVCNE